LRTCRRCRRALPRRSGTVAAASCVDAPAFSFSSAFCAVSSASLSAACTSSSGIDVGHPDPTPASRAQLQSVP
jgi:hypothetical protein